MDNFHKNNYKISTSLNATQKCVRYLDEYTMSPPSGPPRKLSVVSLDMTEVCWTEDISSELRKGPIRESVHVKYSKLQNWTNQWRDQASKYGGVRRNLKFYAGNQFRLLWIVVLNTPELSSQPIACRNRCQVQFPTKMILTFTLKKKSRSRYLL